MRKRPSGQFDIDWSHPLAPIDDNFGVAVHTQTKAFPDNHTIALGGDTKREAGNVVSSISTTSGAYLLPPIPSYNTDITLTIIATVIDTQNINMFAVINSNDEANGSAVGNIGYIGSNSGKFIVVLVLKNTAIGSGTAYNINGTIDLEVGEEYTITLRFLRGDGMYLYVDGVLDGYVATPAAAVWLRAKAATTKEGILLGYWDSGVSYKGKTALTIVEYVDRGDAYVKALHKDPYQILKPIRTIPNNATYAALFGLSQGQIISIGLATETSQARLIDSAKNKDILQTNENDTAQSFTSSTEVSILQAVEHDSVFPTAQIKTKQINQSIETNSALSIRRTKSKLINLSVESNTAFLFSKEKQLAINVSQENDEAFVFTVINNKNILLGVSSEIDASFALNTEKTRSIIQALESDAAHPVTTTGSYLIGTALENDSAAIIDKAKALNIKLAGETDSSLIVNPLKQLSVGQALESDNAFSFEHSIAFLINTADELDSAFNLLQNIYYTIGLAEEFDTGLLIQLPDGGYIYACKLTANINDTIEANICS